MGQGLEITCLPPRLKVRTRIVTEKLSSPMSADPGTSSPLSSGRLELGDGRRLGYVEYGDPAGCPVLLFPGVPGSRLQGHPDRSMSVGTKRWLGAPGSMPMVLCNTSIPWFGDGWMA